MDLETLLEDVRERYIDRFRAFIERQRVQCDVGGPEMKFELGGADAVFRGLYCADFVVQDKGADIVEFQPGEAEPRESLSGEWGFIDVTLEAFSWDKFVIEWEPKVLSVEALNSWFELWFDISGRRRHPDSEFADCIHCVVMGSDRLTIDLGTAPVDAVLSLLDTLEQEGVERVRIS